MSKAFTSESDENEDVVAPPLVLPPGTRNYVTPKGAQRFEAEREQLMRERKLLHDDSFEGKRRLAKIDRRLSLLTERVQSFHVIDPAQQAPDTVQFGATVTIREGSQTQRWRIVGIDEMNLDEGEISWMSPLATALLQTKVGDVVSFQKRRMTIEKIEYHS